tara:strand:+ start:5602 stop:6225 length:624 start_codon:yes stop_codon:yes gene_type:complete
MMTQEMKQQNKKIRKIQKWNAEENTPEQQFNKGLKFINQKTITQRNAYYESVVKWESEVYDRLISQATKELNNPNTIDRKKESLKQQITHSQEQKANTPLAVKTLTWLSYAKEDFDRKIEKVAQKLVSFGFCGLRDEMEVVDVSNNHSRGLDFYIKCTSWSYSEIEESFGGPKRVYVDKGRAHARLVWVSCYDKASHWRFICTKKSK